MSTWTERQYKYIQGRKNEEIKATNFTVYSIAENSSITYGFNKSYIWIWIVPAIIGIILQMTRASGNALDLKGVVFVVCVLSLFLVTVILINRKKKAYTKNLRASHKGNEILMTDQAFIVSAGELTRSEPNVQLHTNNGLINYAMVNGFEYLEIPFKGCRSFKLNNHTLYLYPSDGALQTFEITLGDWRYDSEMLTKLRENFLKKLPEEP